MAELASLTRVVADGYHNAFTDLRHWRGQYYLTFRRAQGHGVAPPGDVLVWRSPDLTVWEEVARFDTGGDDRDPKLQDAGDRLALSFGTWFPRWRGAASRATADHDLITHLSVTRDGTSWSTPRQVYGVNYWLWRITAADGAFWCPAYHFARRDDRHLRSVHLLRSEDLFDWRLVTLMRAGGGPGEPVLYQPGADTLRCVARTLEPDHHAWLGTSRAPYVDWVWRDLGVMIHAPVTLDASDRGPGWIVAGRSREKDLPAGTCTAVGEQRDPTGHHTSVWAIEGTGVRHLLTVPSGGDCSYCGLAPGLEDGTVVMSYYSQHERLPLPADPPTPADVYLAHLSL